MDKLFNDSGERLYLTHDERQRFIEHAKQADGETHTFSIVLAYTGARISEALALTPARIDFDARSIVIETQKRRRRGVFRSVPVPDHVLDALQLVHNVRQAARDPKRRDRPLWPRSRVTMWRRIKAIMAVAEISGSQASPHGLRHAFGANAAKSLVPARQIQKWMGHASIETTMIYVDLFGVDERDVAERMW